MRENFVSLKKLSIFAPAIRNDAHRFDSLAQQVEHNTFNVGVLGSSPKRITYTNGKIKTGEIGGLDFHRNKVHLFASYFSDFLHFANFQLPE